MLKTAQTLLTYMGIPVGLAIVFLVVLRLIGLATSDAVAVSSILMFVLLIGSLIVAAEKHS